MARRIAEGDLKQEKLRVPTAAAAILALLGAFLFGQGAWIHAKALLALVNDLLDVAKIEAGRVELDDVPFDLNDVLKHIVAPMAASAKQKGLDLSLNVAPNVPVRLSGDPV